MLFCAAFFIELLLDVLGILAKLAAILKACSLRIIDVSGF